jgi:hypothetical protein
VFCRLEGDPVFKTQGLLVVFVSLLLSLFFSVLFFRPPMPPVCADPADESTCRMYSCPTCWELYRDTDCRSGELPDPADVCTKYTSSRVHQACESRPLTVCHRLESDEYVEPIPDIRYPTSDRVVCKSGTLVRLEMNYTRPDGAVVPSACEEFGGDSLAITIAAAVFTSLFTIPVAAFLNMLFKKLRHPIDRAVEGDWDISIPKLAWRKVLGPLVDRLCCKPPTAVQQIVVKRKRLTAAHVDTHTPAQLDRKRPLPSFVPYCCTLLVGTACTMLIGMVLVTFTTKMTAQWVLAALLSLLTTWAMEPIKQTLVIFAMMRLCSRKDAKTTARAAHTATKLALSMSAHSADPDESATDGGWRRFEKDGTETSTAGVHRWVALREAAVRAEMAADAKVGFGRIVALHHRSSTSYQIR